MMIRAALRRLGSAVRATTGFSLIETIVAMSIFAVFMGLVMAAIIVDDERRRRSRRAS